MRKQMLKRLLSVVFTALAAIVFFGGSKVVFAADPSPKKAKIEVVFVLDTTGSMGGLISAAKTKIWSIANTIATAKPAPEIKIGLVAYRDKGDAYITKIVDITENIDSVYKELMNFQAGGGGDTPESVNQALHESVTKSKWSDDKSTYKVIFLVGDCPPHMDYQDDVKYKESCKMAVEKGIIINTIQCGADHTTTPIWQEIAKLAEGEFFTVSQSGDYVAYVSPYDKEITEKSRALDATRVYYGTEEFQDKKAKSIESDSVIYKSAPSEAVAERSVFNASAAGAKNFLGAQELVSAVSKGEVKLDEIKESELPAVMQKMGKDERADYVQKQNEEREKLSKEVKALSEKRQQYIDDEMKKEKGAGKDSLDAKIFNSIKKQAKDKDIIYE